MSLIERFARLIDGHSSWPACVTTTAPETVPVDGLPGELADMVCAMESALQIPRDLGWMAVVTSASAAVSGYTVEVMPGWIEPCVLWGLAAAGPGESKSPTLKLSHVSTACREIEDVTPEALAVILASGRRAWIRTAEGASLSTVLGTRYGEGAASLLLQCYSGENFQVSRKSGEDLEIENPRVVVTAFLQPEVLRGLTSDPLTRGQGAWARFMLFYPEARIGRRVWTDLRPVPRAVTTRYQSLISESARRDLRVIQLSAGAREAILAHRQQTESHLIGKYAGCTDWASKSTGLLARLAGVVAVLRGKPEVPARYVDALAPAVDALGSHAARVLSSNAGDPLAARVKSYLVRTPEPHVVSLRDIQRGVGSPPVRDVARTVESLVRRGYLRPVAAPARAPGRAGQPPSPQFEVRPLELWPEGER